MKKTYVVVLLVFLPIVSTIGCINDGKGTNQSSQDQSNVPNTFPYPINMIQPQTGDVISGVCNISWWVGQGQQGERGEMRATIDYIQLLHSIDNGTKWNQITKVHEIYYSEIDPFIYSWNTTNMQDVDSCQIKVEWVNTEFDLREGLVVNISISNSP